MGNMAIPVYWFGYVGGALFVAMTGLVYGALGALQIQVAMRGGVVMLWLMSKVFSYATFAVQQGEYWMMFGSRTLFTRCSRSSGGIASTSERRADLTHARARRRARAGYRFRCIGWNRSAPDPQGRRMKQEDAQCLKAWI